MRFNYFSYIVTQIDMVEEVEDGNYRYGTLLFRHKQNQFYETIYAKDKLQVNLTYQTKLITKERVNEYVEETFNYIDLAIKNK